MKRVLGLDSIRFVCASFVLFGHLGVPFLNGLFTLAETSHYFETIATLIGLNFNSGAAVVVFFIISGFCIHYPFKDKKNITIIPYYTRRLIRISIPALLAIFLYIFFKVDLKGPDYGVFWSIICEIIYYLIYPSLFIIRKFIKWETIIVFSFLLFLALFVFEIDIVKAGNHNYPAFGLFNWIIGLPCWLLGCWLAENYTRFKVLPNYKMWMFRALMIVLCLLLNIVKFHVHSIFGSNSLTLNAFSFLACIWLGFEISFFQKKNPIAIIERLGKWSYSLYIIHPVTPNILVYCGLKEFTNTNNPVTILFSFLLSYTFYLCIEKPSNKFSAFISSLFVNRETTERKVITPIFE